MKKVSYFMAIALLSVGLNSCSEDCHECHYENANNVEVELGEKCDDELTNLEAEGYTVDGVKYEVHCHEH